MSELLRRGLATASRRRVALVTGAAQGIGRGIALRLANDGYDVAVNDLQANEERLEELRRDIANSTRGSGGCVVLSGDISVEDSVSAIVSSCADQFGRLDVMVANAGIAIVKPLLETSSEEVDRVMSVNFRGVMLCYKYAALQMIAQGEGGRIIGACSANGKAGAPNVSIYSASKFAVRGLTQSVALEWGKYGITVNSYAPARILTPMLEGYDLAITSKADGMQKGDFLEQLRKNNAMGYLAGPEDVAGLVSYLASPEARFVTGQTFSVNGGAHVD